MFLHRHECPSESASHQAVLVDEPIGIHEPQSRIHLSTHGDPVEHRAQHRTSIAIHDSAHDRRTSTGTGDHAAVPVDVPNRIQQGGIVAGVVH